MGELLSQFFNVGLASSSGEDYSYQGGFFSGLSGMATEVSWGEGANFHVNDWWFGEDYDYEEEEDDGHKDKHDDDDGRKDRKDKHDDDDGRKDRKDKYDDDDGHKDHGDWGHKGKDKDHGGWGHKGKDKHHGSWGHNDFVYAPQWPSWVEEDNSYDYYESNSPSLNASVGFWSPFSEFFGSYSYDYSYDSYDYTYSYLDFFGDDLLGSLFGELDGALFDLQNSLLNFTHVADNFGPVHLNSSLWLEQRMATAEAWLADLETRENGQSEDLDFLMSWVEQDMASVDMEAMSAGADGAAFSPFSSSGGYPWGLIGASAPWAVVPANGTADAPAVLSVDMSGASGAGLALANLTGAFASCASRGADGSLAGIFSAALQAALAGGEAEGHEPAFQLFGSRIAEALDGVELECSMFGFVNGSAFTDEMVSDLNATMRAMRDSAYGLPLTHTPPPCPPGASYSTMGPHPACRREGEVIEALGAFGVKVPPGAVVPGAGTVTVEVEVVNPLTGEPFTVQIAVKAHSVDDVRVKTMPHRRGEVDEESDSDSPPFALIGTLLGAVALLVSLIVAVASWRRRRGVVLGRVVLPQSRNPSEVVPPVASMVSPSMLAKMDKPDPAVIVSMPSDLMAEQQK